RVNLCHADHPAPTDFEIREADADRVWLASNAQKEISPMDVAVFHQNTRNLSPADDKFTYYKTRFKDIRKSMTSGYAIAGLTELLGDPRSLARKVPELTKMLDAKLSTGVVIAIGQLSSP